MGYAGGRTLILHWNGSSWRRVASPSPASYSTLTGISATSASNAWAVGYAGSRTVILHWNGRSWG